MGARWLQWRGAVITGGMVLGIATAVALVSVGTVAAVSHTDVKPSAVNVTPKVLPKPKPPVAPTATEAPGTVHGTVLTAPGGYYTVTAWDADRRT